MMSSEHEHNHLTDRDPPWDIDRYLLEDPNMNREEFEQRMLDCPELALQVARRAEQLEAIQAATLAWASGRHAVMDRARMVRAASLATLLAAACLLIGLVAWSWLPTGGAGMEELASHWLELEADELAGVVTEIEPEGQSLNEMHSISTRERPENDMEEWLLDSAAAFFSESAS